eukprot:CAMPEP_0181331320 /NCGR_PEP_ID=MMETSP1101-20121128/24432_1 /TAXON_ID=46948 /ORGANISM="Rhodomonas abbreviata, Strain Caron Lab Isolate" /LENGTH=276 /DNA_ID=CAMNT_0023440759 /DNA_START=174 /DNA_END=1001 /DNA_ORIENTATION=+
MTTIRQAIEKYEEKTGDDAGEAKNVMLCGQMPPIAKMDGNLGKLVSCEHLAISSNNIERIAGLKMLKRLKSLSLGRNQIKRLDGLEDVAGTLEQLWLSYNFIEKLLGIEKMKAVKTLYLSNNMISSWNEVSRLAELPCLEELLLQGNPICDVPHYRLQVAGICPSLHKLDSAPVIEEEKQKGRNFLLASQMVVRFGNLAGAFRKMDTNSDGSLSLAEIEGGIRDYGFAFEEDELTAFLSHADTDKDGKVQYEELISNFEGLTTDMKVPGSPLAGAR